MAKRGARSTERGRERTSSVPAAPSAPSLAPLKRSVALPRDSRSPGHRADAGDDSTTQPRVQRSSNPVAQPAELARDERETHLLDEFFSWPPPPVDYTPPPFEPARMSRGSRVAMWATMFMLTVSFVGFGGFIAYHDLIVPEPAELSDADPVQSFDLPTPILANDELSVEPTRSDLRARLATRADLVREAQETEAAQEADDIEPTPSERDLQPTAAQETSRLAATDPQPAAAASGVPQKSLQPTAAPDVQQQLAANDHPASYGPPHQPASAATKQPTAAPSTSLGVVPQVAPASKPASPAAAPATVASNAQSTAPVSAKQPAPPTATSAVQPTPASASSSARQTPAAATDRPGNPQPTAAPTDAKLATSASPQPAKQASTSAARATVSAGNAEHAEPVAAAKPSADVPPSALTTPDAAKEPTSPSAADDNASFDDLVARARKLTEQGDAKQALLTYNRALAPRPHAVEALLGKAAAQFALRDYDAAKSTAEQAIALDPQNRDGLMLIGSTWEQLGNRAAAKDMYQRCVEQTKDDETRSGPCRKRLVQLDAKP